MKTIVANIKNAFNGLSTVKERINELEDRSVETFQTEI